MDFNVDKYSKVIVEQIQQNFSDLYDAVAIVPKLEKEVDKLTKIQEKSPNTLDEREAKTKVALYKQSIQGLVSNYDAYRSIEPLSVGLFGEWGSGKTHLLKLIENQIIDEQKKSNNPFKQITIPVFFNAWRFEKEEHLIIPLFQTLLATIEEFDSKHLSKSAKKQLGRTKERLKILSFSLAKGLKLPRNIKSAVASLLSGDYTVITDFFDMEKVSKEFKEKSNESFPTEENLKKLLQSERIESIYMNIPKWIEKITIADRVNFVFLIDDLDRCLPENTLKMLESIKLFLDVPSCAFVLAIDDDVVECGVAYHYRDYLKDIVRLDGKTQKQSEELPITGHEYLEKMIQLPFRIPVIDSNDVLGFLQKYYGDRFSELLDDEKEQLVENKGARDIAKKSEEVLKFFADTIPPKPRKIKRTAMLFQAKINILKELEQHNLDPILVAKLTLLELFAPKLLRFIQNNNYKEMFDVLHDFSNLTDTKDKEAKNSLANSSRIKNWIESQKNEEDKRVYTKLLEIVEESYHSRMVFKLDYIFKERLEKQKLIEAMEQKTRTVIAQEEKELINLISKEFEALLFGEGETQWRKAFDNHELFEEGKALLTVEAIEEITKKAKGKKGFCDNPKWLLIVAEYITQEQFIKLLEDIYPYRMNKYQTTFEEYDRYCEATGVKKPKDEGWGRGDRPVINVSWEDATAYAKWLSKTSEEEYRLPTEDEWYLACNVGAKTDWHFGNNESELKEYAWYRENSKNKTHPVGKKKPNKLGLYDMHGNVWEWCKDWYDIEEKEKVLRGGSWDGYAGGTRSAGHDGIFPIFRLDIVGFRLLRTLP